MRLHALVRYVNILFVLLFASDVPMPLNKIVLLSCSSVALVGNALLHIFAVRTKRYRLAAYFLLGLDFVTIMPAICFSGFIFSPFVVVLALTVFAIYYVELDSRVMVCYGGGMVAAFVALFAVWWMSGMRPVAWTPAEYPVFTVAILAVQIMAFGAIMWQSRLMPHPMQRELERQEAMLVKHQHQAEIGSSLAAITHEMRNPLTALTLCAGQIESLVKTMKGAGKAAVLRHVATCQEGLSHLDRMLESVLAYARERKGQYRMVPHDVGGIIQRAAEFMKLKYGRHRIGFKVDSRDGGSLTCDADAMHQVLVNLLDNAVQNRSSARPLEVGFRVIHQNAKLVISLDDNGKGIPADRLERLFERFSTFRPGGTGLGLFVVKQIVVDHGGTIEAHSTEGAGAAFVITLPTDGSPAPDGVSATGG